MDQSSVIGAALIIAYAIFVITKGELPCYLSLLGIATAANCPPSLQPAGCGGTGTSTSTSVVSGGGGGVGVGISLPPLGGLGGLGGLPPIGGDDGGFDLSL